ncbi:MAG: hypothetical protein JO076_13960 [Verrucomicrobia bacterium]|nr:hypothetical protein [Verrucomicrobiota bacterium]
MNRKSLISVAGGAAILLGCLLPVMHVPILGSISYLAGEGKIVACLGVAIIVLALFKRVGWAAGIGIIAAIVAAVDFSTVLEKLGSVPTDNPIAEAMVRACSPGEAWAVIALGIIAVVVALFVPDAQNAN